MAKDITHVIKDPVYGIMSASAAEHMLLKPFIDHPLMQRLRHIKQLSFVDLIFPGAVHTRFNHSLGCSYLCSRIYKQLYPECDVENLDSDHQVIILAGLLHDIGHGPFSHVFEKVNILAENKIKHEHWFSHFCNELFDDVKNVDHGIRERLINIFNNKNDQNTWIKSVISSQIDADRMDYILRDSYACGVKYGVYDLEWLISCMNLRDGGKIVLTEKGVGCAEQFLEARALMYKNVYLHLKSSAIAKCVVDFINQLTEEVDQIRDIIPKSRLINFIDKINEYKDRDKKILMTELYKEYKYLTDYDVWYAIREVALNKTKSVCHELADRLYNRKLPKTINIESRNRDSITKIVEDRRKELGLEKWQIDVVRQDITFYEDNDQPVYIEKNDKPIRIEESSPILSKLTGMKDRAWFLYVDYDAYQNDEVQKLISDCGLE